MTLQASGAISLADVQAEFGGSNPISMSEYYGAASGVPESGAISLSHFHGASGVMSEVITVTEGSVDYFGSKIPSANYGFDNISADKIGSRLPTTFRGAAVRVAALHMNGGGSRASSTDFYFVLAIEGNRATSFFDRVYTQGLSGALTGASLAEGGGGTATVWGSPVTAPVGRFYYPDSDVTSFKWPLGGDVSRWDGSGTSTVIIEYQ